MYKTIRKVIDNLLPLNLRDCLFGFKRFQAKNRLYPQPAIIFFTEKNKYHGGFADRMKGIVTLFHYCLIKNISFKINYTFPFELSEFLLPNEYNWQIDKNKISFNRKEAKLFLFAGSKNYGRYGDLLNLKINKQIHAFCNFDYLELLNFDFKTSYTWGELYKKLFKPTEELQNAIDKHLKIIGGKYICAVFRFQNLFGDFAEYDYKSLKESEKTILTEKCKNAVIQLQQSEKQKILAASDSETFLKALENSPNIFSFPAKVVHIDSIENEANSVYMKSFLDFYLISESQKIYSIGTKEMYKSEFPMYAAKVNNIPFERILIK